MPIRLVLVAFLAITGTPKHAPAPPPAAPPPASAPPPVARTAPPPPKLDHAPDDPLDALYRSSLSLGPGGVPIVTVLLMAGQRRVEVRAVGGALLAHVRPHDGEAARTVRVPEGQPLELVPGAGRDSGDVRRYPVLADLALGDAAGLARVEKRWRSLGEHVRAVTVGSVFGFGGKVVDNRRRLVLLDGPGDAAWATRASDLVASRTDLLPALHEVLRRRPSGPIKLENPAGEVLATADSLVSIEADGGGHLLVSRVEYGVGYKWHGFADRSYEGTVHVVVGPKGLAVVDAVSLESLLRGVVPAETYASAPAAALEAQAVSARSEVLAKIGVRHLADPALVCASQHCQVYKGLEARTPATDAAVAATRGEVLVDAKGHIVDAVYSAVCGGHTENNDTVWAQSPNPVLRGRPDFDPTGKWQRYAAGVATADVEAWIDSSPPAWCNLASMKRKGKFRWTRRIEAARMDRLVARLHVGSVRKVVVLGRGVSGRAKAVRIVGTKGSHVVHYELPIRRLFANLNSAMFVVHVETGPDGVPTAFVFKGGGWGHGVGMCQMGAIGMAEHGYDAGAILRHYYNGARILNLY